MRRTILRHGKRFIKRLLGARLVEKEVRELYDGNDYLEAYSQHTDLRVEQDPHLAVGGKWEELGRIQFEFLLKKGLRPHNTFLDIGCGTLRGGRHFIKYLDAGNYSGMDISSKAIAYAKQLVQEERLTDKCPRLLVNKNKDLKFHEFHDEVFEYILAQSIFTHLMPEHIEECFENIGLIMKDLSVFYFTYNNGKKFRQIDVKNFCHPFSFFDSMATKYGFNLKDCSIEYNHPRGQSMIELMRK